MQVRRYLQSPIEEDLKQKMVFLAGPRQVGKTTLAKQILETEEQGLYLSWDHREEVSRSASGKHLWPLGLCRGGSCRMLPACAESVRPDGIQGRGWTEIGAAGVL